MEIKLFELRDRATFMPMMAVRLLNRSEVEFWLLRRAGFGERQLHESAEDPYIILIKLDGVQAEYDPFQWKSSARTLPRAHLYILDNWTNLKSGDLIDIEYIMGETENPKRSERGEIDSI